jgi:hypothetical protein
MEPAALEELWQRATEEDTVYLTALQCVKGGERRFSAYLELKASIAECHADGISVLHFRNRKWVPNSELLRTRLIHEIHASPATGHPGREGTYKILARDYFWSGMSNDIRHCDTCGRNKPWRDGLQGFLKPLPLP